MKVWLTHERTASTNDAVKLWFKKPHKVFNKTLNKEYWTLGEDAVFCYPHLTLGDVNYLVTEENSPLELDFPFLQEFVVDQSQLTQQNIL